jgi:hypothetical protein
MRSTAGRHAQSGEPGGRPASLAFPHGDEGVADRAHQHRMLIGTHPGETRINHDHSMTISSRGVPPSQRASVSVNISESMSMQ